MTFEEEFPSLKGFPMYFLRKDMSETIDGSMFDCGGIPAKEVQEHCLDKQKVKEILEKCPQYSEHGSVSGVFVLSHLKKELGF